MSRKVNIAIVLVLVMCLAFSYSYHTITKNKEKVKSRNFNSTPISAQTDYKDYAIEKGLECNFFNETDFQHIKQFEVKKDVGTIHGCIVPHHLTAKDLIHEVFQNVVKDKEKYKTVILFGPDHESEIKGKISTTLKNWDTPFGTLKTNQKITTQLINKSILFKSDKKLVSDHSLSGIIPFIKHYLPNVEVVTFTISKQTKLKQIDELIKNIKTNIDIDSTLFIGSVDFSHYLTLEEANNKDLISMKAIESSDKENILKFTNDNLDSPLTIVCMLDMMKSIEKSNIYRLNHSNQDLILKTTTNSTTSYITYLFH